jgi:hypothetical protein
MGNDFDQSKFIKTGFNCLKILIQKGFRGSEAFLHK